MILAVISAIFCLGAAVLILTPYFRRVTLLRPLAYYLFFEGVWQLLSYIILQVDPTNGFIANVNYIGTIVILGYYVFVLLKARLKGRKPEKEKKQKKGKV